MLLFLKTISKKVIPMTLDLLFRDECTTCLRSACSCAVIMVFVLTVLTLWNHKELVTNSEVKQRDEICNVYPQ